MLTNSAFIKLKFFLWKIRAEGRRRKAGDAELNSLSNCHKFRWRVGVWTAEETEKKQKLIYRDEFSFHEMKIFLMKSSS